MTVRVLKKSLLVTALALGLLPGTWICQSPPAFSAEIQKYRRKYISFYPTQRMPMNKSLQSGIRKSLPRFNYNNLSAMAHSDLMTFLAEVKRYQKEHAGELASMKENDSVKFGDKVIPWSETKLIMDSAYVFAPHWSFTPIQLTGPHKHKKSGSEYWAVHAESKVMLDVYVYKLAGDTPVKYTTLSSSWNIHKEIRLDNIHSLLREIRRTTGVEIDLENPLHIPVIMEALKLFPEFKEIEASDPYVYMLPVAEESITEDSFLFLTTEMKRMDDFILSGEVLDAKMKEDQVKLGFGDKETPQSLGVKMDNAYKIIEYQMKEGMETPVEVGFMKVRQLNANDVTSQPIIVGRDFELGDQVREYPKTGLNASLKAGTASIGVAGEDQNMFNPQVQLDVEYDLAPATDVSELFAVLSGGISFPFATKRAPTRSITAGNVEIGLMKRWYMRQLVFSLGIRGGMLGGMYSNSSGDQFTQATFGGTALAGLHFQATPDLIFGLDGGWRYFLDGGVWTTKDKSIDSSVGGLSSNGPVINLFANYAF